ncbi:MAG: alpha-amylase family glycosyl hydrolase [Elusimicrobiota bacterium]|jgi:glycosidase
MSWDKKIKKTVATILVASLLTAQQGLFVSEAVAQVVAGPAVKAVPAAQTGTAGLSMAAGRSNAGSQVSVTPGLNLSLSGLPTISAPAVVSPSFEPAISAVPSALPSAAALPAAALPAAAPSRGSVKTALPAPAIGTPVQAPAQEAPRAAPDDSDIPNSAPVGDYVTEGLRLAKKVTERVPFEAEAAFLTPKNYDEPISYPVEYPADAPSALSEVELEPAPDAKYTPSPEDWSDEAVYFPLIDRFNNSADSRPVGDPRNGRARHGGDLKGLIAKLDYIKEAGFTTLLINPVFVNAPDGYHGYSPLHFMGIDPHLGTMEDFKTLVKELHKRGMYLVFDLAINHAGAVFEYKGNAEWEGMDKPQKEISKWNYELYPNELKDPKQFSRRGVLNNWDDPDQKVNADFPPYQRRFDTANPETQDMIIQVAKWWIKEADVDGFRLDAYKHIAPSFWPRFHREVSAYAAKLGKKNFFRPGEILTHVNEEIAGAMGPDGINAAYNYPDYLKSLQAMQGRAPTRLFEESLAANLEVLGDATRSLLHFIDTQDTYRFLDKSTPLGVLWVALSYVLFSMGIPLVYYGTEQAFRQAHVGHYDPRNREDMFPEGKYKSESSAGDQFNTASPTFQHLKKLLSVRKDLPALRRGEQYVRWADQSGPGIYAFSRIYKGQEVVVVMNTAGESRFADFWVDNNLTPAGTTLKDRLDGKYKVATYGPQGGGSKVAVEVPAYGVRVLVRPAK